MTLGELEDEVERDELVFRLEKLIHRLRKEVITPDNAAIVTTATNLRAILLAPFVGNPKD